MKEEKKASQGNKETKYLEVLSSNITAVSSLANMVRGTVGPKGLDVMLIDEYGDYNCTNDGVEILSKIDLTHPAAKLTVEVAKAQENRVGDGTTTATIITDSLLRLALDEIQAGHSAIRLNKGINKAITELSRLLKEKSREIKDINDEKLKDITNISARNNDEITEILFSSAKKIITENDNNRGDGQTFFTKDLDFSNLIKTSLASKSKIIDGLYIKKKTHYNYDIGKNFTKAPTLIIEGALEPDPLPAEAIGTDEGVRKFNQSLEEISEAAKKIAKAGTKVILVDASMNPSIEEFFANEKIFVLTRVRKSDLNTLALTTGAKMLTREKIFNSSVDELKTHLGSTKKLIEDNGLIIEGAKFYLPTILISAETQASLNEKERIAIDAAKALQSSYRSGYVLGEGVAELNLINEMQKLSDKESDPELKAGMNVVTKTLSALFSQIVENAGFKAEDLLEKLMVEKANGANNMGYDLDSGELIDLEKAGILDPLEVKTNAFRIASEIATQILRINLVVQAKNL